MMTATHRQMFFLLVLNVFTSMTVPHALSHPTHWVGVTEEFPPYNYTKNDVATGYATELVKLIISEVGDHISVQVLPWSRAMLLAGNEPNTLIFSMLRTENRENRYRWIGQIDNLSIYLWQRHNDVAIKSKAPLDIVYGAIRSLDDNNASLLASRYSVDADKIVWVEKAEQLIGLLLKHRVDRIIMAENAWQKVREEISQAELNQLQRYDLMVRRNLYIATGLQTSEEAAQRLRESYRKVTMSELAVALKLKYGLSSLIAN